MISDLLINAIKEELIKLLLKQILGDAVTGIKFKVLNIILSRLFDIYLKPLLEGSYKEGQVNVSIKALREKLIKYEKASTRTERIDRFNDIP